MPTLSRMATDWPSRPAVNWLNYRGDQTHLIYPIQPPLGPNAYGEHLYPVIAEYDWVTNWTRVGLTPIAPPAEAA